MQVFGDHLEGPERDRSRLGQGIGLNFWQDNYHHRADDELHGMFRSCQQAAAVAVADEQQVPDFLPAGVLGSFGGHFKRQVASVGQFRS